MAQEQAARVFAPRSAQAGASAANPLDHTLVVAPVAAPQTDQPGPSALLEIALRPGLSPAAYQGAEEFLKAAAEIAAEFHVLDDLARLRTASEEQQRLLDLARSTHRARGACETAAAIASDACRAIQCDRVSVLAPRGGGCRLLAVSGVDRANRVRAPCARWRSWPPSAIDSVSPCTWLKTCKTPLPEAADALQPYADESHARQVALVPMRVEPEQEDEPGEIVGVLVAESFDATRSDVARDRVTEAARVCAPALRHALQLQAIPLARAQQSLTSLLHTGPLIRLAIAAGMIVTAIAALVFVPAELRIEARGQLQPVVKRHVFAPGEGIVESVLVSHGQFVNQGDLLAQLRDPQLDLEIKRAEGERQTAQRQLDAVRATRTRLDRA